jgi:DNA-binding CsgD family transcriptional regulator
MDQVMDARVRENDRIDRIVSALRNGVILVDSKGQVAWMDANIRRRVNGGLHDLDLPMVASGNAVEGFMSPVEIALKGERTVVCIIQESSEMKNSERDLLAAIQAAMADTSLFARTVLEKLKAMRHGRQDTEASEEIDALSDREQEVLGLICRGTSDTEMSRMLQLSPNTVRNHIASLYRKIGVNRRSAAVIWARERGITGLDEVAARGRRPLALHGNGHSAR